MLALRIALRLAQIALYSSLAYLAIQGAILLQTVQSEAAQVASEAHALTAYAMNRIDLAGEHIAEAGKMVNRHAYEIESLTNERLLEANRILGGAVILGNRRLRDLRGPIGYAATQIGMAAEGIQNVTAQTAQIESQISDSLPLFLDCEHNPDCLFNRYQGSAHAFERTMQAVEKAAPRVADSAARNGENLAGITQDVHEFTSRFLAPHTTKQKVWEGMKLGVYVAGRIVP